MLALGRHRQEVQEVEGQPQLHGESEASLSYMRLKEVGGKGEKERSGGRLEIGEGGESVVRM